MVSHTSGGSFAPLFSSKIDACRLDEYFPSGVYFLFRQEGLVYIGQSVNVYGRLNDHRRDCTGEFDSFSWVQVHPSKLNYHEALAIVEYKPALNTTIPSNERFISFKQMRRALWHEMNGFTIKPHHVAHIAPAFVDSSNRSTRGLEYWDLWEVRDVLSTLQEVA